MTTRTKSQPRPPRPGSPEHALLVALRADPPDPAAVQAARLALVRQWDALAWKQAGKWHRTGDGRGSLDDFHAAAVLGLWEAALKFEPERGYVFPTYASWYVLKYLKEAAHQEAAGGLHVPMAHGVQRLPIMAFGEISAEFGADGAVPFDQTVPDRARGEDELPPEPVGVWRAVSDLLPRRRLWLVVWYRYRCGMTLDQVGAELGVSKERVRQLEVKAVARLRRMGGRLREYVEGAA